MMNPKPGKIGLTRRHLVGSALGGAALGRVNDRAWGATLPPEPPARLALRGFDAVSYFLAGTDGPAPGVPGQEFAWNGRSWRFACAANRAAFAADPPAYAPRLGGFDPLGVVEGRFVATDPLIFLIASGPGGRRLYLFRTLDNRAAFAADADLPDRAEACWPALRVSTDADPAD